MPSLLLKADLDFSTLVTPPVLSNRSGIQEHGIYTGSTRDQAYLDHVYVNHPSLFATRRRAPLSTSDHAIIRIMPKIYSKEHHQAFTRRSCRVIKQRALAPSNIANYQSMLEATDFSIFKTESINEYADSLSDYCQFCFDTCCPLETIYVSTTKISSPHLNRLRTRKSVVSRLARSKTYNEGDELRREGP